MSVVNRRKAERDRRHLRPRSVLLTTPRHSRARPFCVETELRNCFTEGNEENEGSKRSYHASRQLWDTDSVRARSEAG